MKIHERVYRKNVGHFESKERHNKVCVLSDRVHYLWSCFMLPPSNADFNLKMGWQEDNFIPITITVLSSLASNSTKQSFLGSKQFLRWSKNSLHFYGTWWVHYSVRNSAPLVLSQMNPIHTLPFYFCKVDFRIIVSLMPMSSMWSLISPPKPCVHFASPPHVPHAPPTPSSILSRV